jgi:LPXTG-motif cell wall-anchored protein
MQQIMYDEAPYHILYYDSSLHAYRTDRFGNWQNQPAENGTPFFGYGPFAYTKLTAAAAAPSPSPSAGPTPAAPSPGTTPAPSAAPSTPTTGSDSTPLIIGGIGIVAVLAAGFLFLRRRGPTQEEE